MGDLGYTGPSTATYTDGMIWFYNSSKSDNWYKVEKKKKKDFIEESEFKV